MWSEAGGTKNTNAAMPIRYNWVRIIPRVCRSTSRADKGPVPGGARARGTAAPAVTG
jgi:hypothetical protein